jgi:hypothetical protein
MIMRGLTSTGDWLFGNGLQSYLTGEAAIEANIKTRVLSWIGDCYFDMFTGVDWKNRLDVGQQENLEQEVAQVILQSYGVTGINSIGFNFSGQTRLESITASITTIYSPSSTITIPNQAVGQ